MEQDSNLQKEISQDLQNLEVLEDNRDVILTWHESGGSFPLNDVQVKLNERWEYADALLRRNLGKKRREEIAELIMERWGIKRATAYKDIVDAQFVFSSCAALNKKYLVGIKIEALERDIMDARLKGDGATIAKLERVQVEYIKIYPDDHLEKSPQTFLYVFDETKVLDEKPTVEDAEFIIDEAIKNLPDGNS